MKWFLIALVAGAASFGGSYAAQIYPTRERAAADSLLTAAQAACPDLGERLKTFEAMFVKDPEQELLNRFKKPK